MKNVDLNPGGLIGALACGAAAIAVAFTMGDLEQSSHRFSKLVISAVIGGALTGNFLWARLLQK